MFTWTEQLPLYASLMADICRLWSHERQLSLHFDSLNPSSTVDLIPSEEDRQYSSWTARLSWPGSVSAHCSRVTISKCSLYAEPDSLRHGYRQYQPDSPATHHRLAPIPSDPGQRSPWANRAMAAFAPQYQLACGQGFSRMGDERASCLRAADTGRRASNDYSHCRIVAGLRDRRGSRRPVDTKGPSGCPRRDYSGYYRSRSLQKAPMIGPPASPQPDLA